MHDDPILINNLAIIGKLGHPALGSDAATLFENSSLLDHSRAANISHRIRATPGFLVDIFPLNIGVASPLKAATKTKLGPSLNDTVGTVNPGHRRLLIHPAFSDTQNHKAQPGTARLPMPL